MGPGVGDTQSHGSHTSVFTACLQTAPTEATARPEGPCTVGVQYSGPQSPSKRKAKGKPTSRGCNEMEPCRETTEDVQTC